MLPQLVHVLSTVPVVLKQKKSIIIELWYLEIAVLMFVASPLLHQTELQKCETKHLEQSDV